MLPGLLGDSLQVFGLHYVWQSHFTINTGITKLSPGLSILGRHALTADSWYGTIANQARETVEVLGLLPMQLSLMKEHKFSRYELPEIRRPEQNWIFMSYETATNVRMR